MEVFRAYGFDKTLFAATIALLTIGIIMVFSTSAILSTEKFQQPFYFLVGQVAGAGVGLIFILFLLSVRKPFYQNPYFIYTILIGSLVLLSFCFIMPTVANTNRWIQLFGIRFQPSEMAKVSLILFLSFYIDRKKDRLHEFSSLIFPLVIIVLFTLLILMEPDYGTALLLFFICMVLLFLGGVRLRYFFILGAGAAGLFTFFLFQASYRVERIAEFMSPEKDPLGKSFQIIQSQLAIGSGGFLGVSIGESTQKLFFLPCAHTDFIYAILGEEFGLLGTLTILFLFGLVLWRGLKISKRAPNLASQLAAAGLTLALCSQALLNITIVLGLGPPKGVPLPLISFGRSSLICSLIAVGIILNISQRKGNYGNRI